jgi:hypothetical protein
VRDNFSGKVQRILEERAGHQCSVCHKATSGPSTDSRRAGKDGIAAHITATSPKGPRFDPTLSPEERRSEENGIWVCTRHGREIDTDSPGYSIKTLKGLKGLREERAADVAPYQFLHPQRLHLGLGSGLHVGLVIGWGHPSRFSPPRTTVLIIPPAAMPRRP